MTKEAALKFLLQHQPMPSDSALTRETISQYDQVRRHFLRHPALECIPLFLNSFGNGGGFGVYQLVEDLILKFPAEDVVPQLAIALGSTHRGVRYWCSQIAVLFPSNQLIQPLTLLARIGDFDVRYAAITALERMPGPEVDQNLQMLLLSEDNTEIRDLIQAVLCVRR